MKKYGCIPAVIVIAVCVLLIATTDDEAFAYNVGRFIGIGIMIYAVILFVIFLSKGGYKKDIENYMDEDSESVYIEQTYHGFIIRAMKSDTSKGWKYKIYNRKSVKLKSDGDYISPKEAMGHAEKYIDNAFTYPPPL